MIHTSTEDRVTDFRRDDLALEPYLSGSNHINTGTGERIASIVGGSALLYYGFQRLSIKRVLMSLAGLVLLKRGISGHCELNEAIGRNTAKHEGSPVLVKKSITINKPREEVYAFWRKLENLPRFMKHITEVDQLDAEGKRYHWQMEAPKLGKKIDWEAEIVDEIPNERILFRTYNGSDVGQAGEVTFKDGPQGQGTEMQATIKYYPPEGSIGSAIARMFNSLIENVVHEDMRRFKYLLETGQLPLGKGTPGGSSGGGNPTSEEEEK
ncbi:SRPBCC family protein [Cesiribacter andamanensis]|uniref:Putative integral membrane protein n=1 Tax=Cesiribacter andamanensis AMV16 TaxID=1279009 RepID=M7N188_9BACT|nr:SRPBCC family protein [Cesiribacter andamanensis]EMR00981.1 putative integral membrane protein [Cesiribacter andamanensis AMV16]